MPDIIVNFSTSKAIGEYIDKHTLPQIGKMIVSFKQFKRTNPMGQYNSWDKDSKGGLSEYRHWKTGINDVDLWYKVLRNGNFYRIVLIDLATHNESGTLGGGGRQDSYAKHLKTIFNSMMLNMNKPSKRILPLSNSYKSTGHQSMKIITESSAPVSITEAKTKAALYATAWGHPEVSLTLFEKFALVEAITGEKGKYASIAFAIDNKFQKANNIEKSVIKCLTSTGEEVDMELMVFNYQDISDIKVKDNIFAFKMNESVIFLEGSINKTKRVAKTCAAALSASLGKSKMDIHLIESNASISEYKKSKKVEGKLITLESTKDGKEINTVSGLIESNVSKIADKNILGCILEGVMSAAEKAHAEKIVHGMKAKGKDLVKRYGKDRAKSVMYATANKLAQNEDVDDEDSFDKWKEEVTQQNPEFKGKIKFVNKNDHNGKLIVSAQVGDRSLGVFDLDTNQGELLGEGTNIKAKNLLGSFRAADGKTYTYGKTQNKWALKNGLEHEIESGSKLEQNKFGNVKGNVAHIANALDESGTPTLTKMNIRHVWKNDVNASVEPKTPIEQELDEGSMSPKFKEALELAKSEKAAGNIKAYHVDTHNGSIDAESPDGGWYSWYDPKQWDSDDFDGGNDDRLSESVSSFVIEYEIKDAEKTTTGKVTYQGNDQNEAKQRFLDDHKGEGQVTVKSVTAALAEDLGVTDSAIGVTGGQDSAYVVYADANGRKHKKLKHGTNEEITEALEAEGCKVLSIRNGKEQVDESLEQSELDKIIKDALDKAYVTATKAKEQYDRTYTDPEDESFDFDEAVSDAFEAELQSIMSQLDDTVNDASDKVDGYLAGKTNESVEPIKTKQQHYADFMTKFFGLN